MLKTSARLLLYIATLCFLAGCGDVELGSFTPATPSNVKAAGAATSTGGQAVLLSWEESKGTTLSQGATFNVYRGSKRTGTLEGKTKVAEGLKTLFFTDTSASAATSFYQVSATIYNQESAPSPEVSLAAASIPAAATVTGASASGVNVLTWSAVPGATGYLVYRGVTQTGTLDGKMPWGSTGSDSTSFTDKTVTVGLTYYYLVVTTSLTGLSTPSQEIAVTTK